ncbi:hypothetical protein [Nostoc sp.]
MAIIKGTDNKNYLDFLYGGNENDTIIGIVMRSLASPQRTTLQLTKV